MKVIYLASPYRSSPQFGYKSEFGLFSNWMSAHEISRRIWKLGAACISPVSNTFCFSGQDIQDEIFIEGDLEIISRCDAVLLNDNWQTSKGCTAEMEFAEANNIKVFALDDWEDFVNFVKDKK